MVLDRLTPLDREGSHAFAGAVTDWTDVVRHTVEQANNGVVSGYGIEVDGSYTYDGTLLFRVVTQEDQALPDLASFSFQRGTIQAPSPTVVWLRPAMSFALQAKRTTAVGATFTVKARLVGSYWPSVVTLDSVTNHRNAALARAPRVE